MKPKIPYSKNQYLRAMQTMKKIRQKMGHSPEGSDPGSYYTNQKQKACKVRKVRYLETYCTFLFADNVSTAEYAHLWNITTMIA